MSGRARRRHQQSLPTGQGRHAAHRVLLGLLRRADRPLTRRPALATRRARAAERAGVRRRRRTVSLAVTLAVALVAGLAAATASLASAPTLSRPRFATAGTGGWLNDTTLGRTAASDQYAQALVVGLVDGGQQAGFLMRYAGRADRIRVSVSGTGWRIETSGAPAQAGTFRHAASGVLRVEVQGAAVRIRWNGTLVASRPVAGTHPGRHVVPTIRQTRSGVVLRDLRAAALRTPPGHATPSGPATTPGTGTPAGTGTVAGPATPAGASARTWLSGAASREASDGTFGTWRGSAVQIGGTWNDTYDGQVNQWSVCPGSDWESWAKPLDVAFGGIFRSRGETWAAAAGGAYDARWATGLTHLKACWGSRDPGLLYLRFAHEMNLPNDWAVRGGQEADFVRALTRFSTLRYQLLPAAKVVLCPNDGTDGGLGGLDIRKLWPGRDAQGRQVADVYAVDSYNAWPHVTTAAQFTRKINGQYPNGVPLGIERHRRLAERLGVPFALGEWANNGRAGSEGGGGESPAYVQLFNAWARAHAGDVAHPAPGQLLYEIHFNLWTQYALWPQSIQPRTAAAYRAMPWGR